MGDAPWIMFTFPIVHLAVGVGLTYSTLAGFFNHTTLEVDAEEIRVMFDPFPWLGEVTLKTMDVAQVYCKENIRKSENGTGVSYQLMVVTREGKAKKLLSGLESPEVGLYIEQQIETWLHIKDQPVVGEYRE